MEKNDGENEIPKKTLKKKSSANSGTIEMKAVDIASSENIEDTKPTKPIMKPGRGKAEGPPKIPTGIQERIKTTLDSDSSVKDEVASKPEDVLSVEAPVKEDDAFKSFRRVLQVITKEQYSKNQLFHVEIKDVLEKSTDDIDRQKKILKELIKHDELGFLAKNFFEFSEEMRPKILRELTKTAVGKLILDNAERKRDILLPTDKVARKDVSLEAIKQALESGFVDDMDFAIEHLPVVEGEIDSDSVIALVRFLRGSHGQDGIGWLVSVFDKIEEPNLEIMKLLIKGKKAKLVFERLDKFVNLNYMIITDLCIEHDAASELAKNVSEIDEEYHNYVAEKLVSSRNFDVLAKNLNPMRNLSANIANALMKNGYLEDVVKQIHAFSTDVHSAILEEAMNYYGNVNIGAFLVDHLGIFEVDETVRSKNAKILYEAGWANARQYLATDLNVATANKLGKEETEK
jgi:hypothetical protein